MLPIQKYRCSQRGDFSFMVELSYNFNVVLPIIGGGFRIPVDRIFNAISEINEAISLTNDETKLVNAVLDTLCQEMEVECCWVQTISPNKSRLSLAAQRGFSTEMEIEMSDMETNLGFGEQVIGLGQKVVIPDFYNDGLYGLSSFREAGYRWLVAVPMMTYRAHGVVGIACRDRRKYKKETAGLMTVIAGLVGMALLKARLFHTISVLEKRSKDAGEDNIHVVVPTTPPQPEKLEVLEREARPQTTVPVNHEKIKHPPHNESSPGTADHDTFRAHSRRMLSFRRSHGLSA
jgi:hypothetical protein